MELVWLGHSCFRLRGRDAAVVTDPCAPSSGYKLGQVAGDLVTVSNSHPHHNSVELVEGEPVVLDGPGEYEIKGIAVTGFRTDLGELGGAQRNTAYVIEIDDITVCHLGDVANMLPPEHLEMTKDIDVLLVPVGGHCTIGPAQAAEVISQLGPKVVIPMHYATEISAVELEQLDGFLREMGVTEVQPQARLNLTPSSLPPEPTIMVLQYRR